MAAPLWLALDSIEISSEIKDPNYYNTRIPIANQFTALESAAATHTFNIMTDDVSQMGKVTMTRHYYPYAALEINRSNPASEIKSTLFLNTFNGRRQSESDFYYQPGTTFTPLGFIHFFPAG